MLSRLRDLLAEIEDINYYIQSGCVDPSHLSCFKDKEVESADQIMALTDTLLGEAFSAIFKLTETMTQED